MTKPDTHPCPKCRRPAERCFITGGMTREKTIGTGERVISNLMHGNPIMAGIWIVTAGMNALLPKDYHCRLCDLFFKV